jgi:hypothetical protein
MFPSEADSPTRDLGGVCRSVEWTIARGGYSLPIILLSGLSCKELEAVSTAFLRWVRPSN